MPIASDVRLGKDVRINHPELVNLYGCSVGDHTEDWEVVETYIKRRASIGSNATILAGITIGENTLWSSGDP